MKNTLKTGAMAALLACLLGPLASAASVQRDDFPREDGDREAKDAMEGKAPPPLSVANGMNIEGDALDLASLGGKVVVLDFWGTW